MADGRKYLAHEDIWVAALGLAEEDIWRMRMFGRHIWRMRVGTIPSTIMTWLTGVRQGWHLMIMMRILAASLHKHDYLFSVGGLIRFPTDVFLFSHWADPTTVSVICFFSL